MNLNKFLSCFFSTLVILGSFDRAFAKAVVSCKVTNSVHKQYPNEEFLKNQGLLPENIIEADRCNKEKGCPISYEVLQELNKVCVDTIVKATLQKDLHEEIKQCGVNKSGLEKDISWSSKRVELQKVISDVSIYYSSKLVDNNGKVNPEIEVIGKSIRLTGSDVYQKFFAKYNRASEETVVKIFEGIFEFMKDKGYFSKTFDSKMVFSPVKEELFTKLWALFTSEDPCAKVRQAASTFSRAVVEFTGVRYNTLGYLKDGSWNLYAEEKSITEREIKSYTQILEEDSSLRLNEEALVLFKQKDTPASKKLIEQNAKNIQSGKQRVVTVLFGGTGSNLGDAKKFDTYFQGELFAKTAQYLKASDPHGDNIRYFYIPGVGSGYEGYQNKAVKFQYRDQHSNATGTALGSGMHDNVEEAIAILQGKILNPSLAGKVQGINAYLEPPEHINVGGWSRGAVTSILFTSEAGKLSYFSKTRFHLFAVDPVPGGDKTKGISNMKSYENDIAILNPRVKSAVLVYALHERTREFLPVVPVSLAIDAKLDIVVVPGNHSTVVGNAYHKDFIKQELYDLGFLTRHMLASFLVKNGVDKKHMSELILSDKDLVKRHESLIRHIGDYEALKTKSLIPTLPLKSERTIMLHSFLVKEGFKEVPIQCIGGSKMNPECEDNTDLDFQKSIVRNVKTLEEFLGLKAQESVLNTIVHYLRKPLPSQMP